MTICQVIHDYFNGENSITYAVCGGAAVLAHSLRDAGTKKQLAILVTLDTLSADTLTELKVCPTTSPYLFQSLTIPCTTGPL